jgi:hypothetical protein
VAPVPLPPLPLGPVGPTAPAGPVGPTTSNPDALIVQPMVGEDVTETVVSSVAESVVLSCLEFILKIPFRIFINPENRSY